VITRGHPRERSQGLSRVVLEFTGDCCEFLEIILLMQSLMGNVIYFTVALVLCRSYLKSFLQIYVLYLSSNIRHQFKYDYPLNLSILIRGWKEINRDSLSNGEWSGNSSSLNLAVGFLLLELWVKDWRTRFSKRSKCVGIRCPRRWQPCRFLSEFRVSFPRVGLFEIAAWTRVVDPIQS